MTKSSESINSGVTEPMYVVPITATATAPTDAQGYAAPSHHAPNDADEYSHHNATSSNFVNEDDALNSNVKISSRTPVQLSYCPNCKCNNIRTRTRTHPNCMTWVMVGVGAVVFIPICWIPLVMDPLKQTDHFCQECDARVAVVKPLEDCCVKEMV